MRLQQKSLPADTGFPRWGCLNMSIVYGCEDITGQEIEYKALVETIRRAQSTPVPWLDGKMVIDYNGFADGFWNYNLDWWTQEILECLDAGKWTGFPVGKEDKWFADEPWWHRDYIKTFSFIADGWGRPGPGGHYVYVNPHLGLAGNPDKTLHPLLWRPNCWKFLVRRKV